jgi:hypothetical protein
VLYCLYFVFFLLKFLLSPKYPSLLPCPFLCKSHFFLVLFITEIPPKSSSSSSRKSKIQEIFRQLPKHTKPTSVLLLPQIKKLNRSNDQSNPFSNNQKSQMGSQIFPHFPSVSHTFFSSPSYSARPLTKEAAFWTILTDTGCPVHEYCS